MAKGFVAQASITINAPPARVWEALTTPELIKQYLFGTTVVSDWKEGSEIKYKGVWEGKAYEDKGKIIELLPEKRFVSTFWSSLGGTEDKPENYATVTYELEAQGTSTLVKLSQDNNPTEEAKNHSEQNWKIVLDGLKKLLEQ